jgi:hypothetical protein
VSRSADEQQNAVSGEASVELPASLAVLAPFGVWPARAAGAEAVLAPAQRLARAGCRVDLFTLGMRRFERRWPRPFAQDIEEGLREHRQLTLGLVWDRLRGGRARVPPVDFGAWLERMPRRWHERLEAADLVQLESPWGVDFARSLGKRTIFVVHNHELALHQEALERCGWRERAEELEGRAWRESELIFVTHDAERDELERSYGLAQGRVLRLGFGVDIEERRPASAEDRARARAELGLPQDACIGLFPGSAHAPNVSAARWLREQAVELAPSGLFVLLAGSVNAQAEDFAGGRATGPLPSLDACFAAADFGLHPITEGRGMNLKLAQMLASGLPVLSTRFGARGYEGSDRDGLHIVEGLAEYRSALPLWTEDRAALAGRGRAARAYAERALSWEQISATRVRALRHLVTS